MPEGRVQRAIDRRTLTARRRRQGGRLRREIPLTALLAYAVEQRVAPYVSFTRAARATVAAALAKVPVEAVVTPPAGTLGARLLVPLPALSVGPLSLPLGELITPYLAAVRTVLASRELIVRDPAIRGGEPVVRGSRVPVYRLAELRAQGVAAEVLLQEYPSLTPDALEAARLYATLHPRAGRPARPAPWHGRTRTVLLPAHEGPHAAPLAERGTAHRATAP